MFVSLTDTIVSNISRMGDMSPVFAEIIKCLIDTEFYCKERIYSDLFFICEARLQIILDFRKQALIPKVCAFRNVLSPRLEYPIGLISSACEARVPWLDIITMTADEVLLKSDLLIIKAYSGYLRNIIANIEGYLTDTRSCRFYTVMKL